MRNIEYRTLQRHGKCICCGRQIQAKEEKVIHLNKVHKSQVYEVTICKTCTEEFSKMVSKDEIND